MEPCQLALILNLSILACGISGPFDVLYLLKALVGSYAYLSLHFWSVSLMSAIFPFLILCVTLWLKGNGHG